MKLGVHRKINSDVHLFKQQCQTIRSGFNSDLLPNAALNCNKDETESDK